MAVTTIPTLLAGEIPDATKWATILSYIPLTAVKTSSDVRTTTTYIADAHLSIAIPTAGIWGFRTVLMSTGPSGGANGRLKVRYNFPTGSISVAHINGKDNTAVVTADMTDINTGVVFNDSTSPTTDILHPTVGVELVAIHEGTLWPSAPGTLSIDTAQIVASGTTTILSYSYMTVWRVT